MFARRFLTIIAYHLVLISFIVAVPATLWAQQGVPPCPSVSGLIYDAAIASSQTTTWGVSSATPQFNTTVAINGVTNVLTAGLSATCQLTIDLQQVVPPATGDIGQIYIQDRTLLEVLATLGPGWNLVSCAASAPGGIPNPVPDPSVVCFSQNDSPLYGKEFWSAAEQFYPIDTTASGYTYPAGWLLLWAYYFTDGPNVVGPATLPGGTSEVRIVLQYNPSAPLIVTTTSLGGGTIGSTYSQALAASGGTPPYTWSLSSGALPDGLTLAVSTGAISGTPPTTGAFNFTVQVTDDTGATTPSGALSIQIGSIPAPTNLAATQIGNNGTQIQLTWDYGSDPIDGFNVYRKAPSGIYPASPISVPLNNCLSTSTGLNCTYIDPVSPFNTYTYEVRAYKYSITGESANSNEATSFQILLYTEANNTQMAASFQPDAVSLKAVASAFNYDHFNWISFITSVSPDTQLLDSTNKVIGNPPPPVLDPPCNGWWNVAADCLPYYWNEASGPPPQYDLSYPFNSSTTSVRFHDRASNYKPVADHREFMTILVGVTDPIGTLAKGSAPLAAFVWSTNYSANFGGSGGILDFQRTYNVDAPLTPGSGGLFNALVVDISDLPIGVRTALIQAGVQGVSTAPKIDKDAPMTASFLSGQQGINGWYTGPVNITLIATDIDGPSDIATTSYNNDAGSLTAYTGPFTISGDGIHSIQFGSSDVAGNVESPRPSQTINIDATPPSISGTWGPPPNASGWNNSPVTVIFQCTDLVSGLAAGSPPAPTVLSAQGLGQSVSGTCQDMAGNTSTATVSGINIDETPPTIAITIPAKGTTYSANRVVNAAYACTDTKSGPATCNGTAPIGSKIETTPSGTLATKTFAVNASDVAGNSSSSQVTYQVSCHYVTFGINPSTVARGGKATVTGTVMSCTSNPQTVSVKFTLTGPLGPKSCANTSTVMFTTPPFTIAPGTSKTVSFPFFIPKTACTGTFTTTSTTLVGGTPVDSTSATLTVY